MKAKRKGPVDNSSTREALIDATEQLIREEGYAAVSTRRIAAKAGVKGPLIHYYFNTIDDLYLAVFRRIADQGLRRLEVVMASEQPLRALWEHAKSRAIAELTIEFIALAHRRNTIRAEIVQYAIKARNLQIAGITRYFESRGIDPPIPVASVPAFMNSISFMLTLDTSIGISLGHAETVAVMESCLLSLEGPAGDPALRQ